MKITDIIDFNPELSLSEQSAEFQTWYNENVNNQINDQLAPDALDVFDRPISFTVTVDNLTVTVYFIYQFQDSSTWACSEFHLKIV